MRFQVRVTPATEELLQHLEGIENKYRGKRIVALAAMQLAAMTASTGPVQSTTVHAKDKAAEAEPEQQPEFKVAKSVPAWISNASTL